MKLTIDLEVEPDEVEMVTELFSVLRSLTDHVKLRTTSEKSESVPPPKLPARHETSPAASTSTLPLPRHMGTGNPAHLAAAPNGPAAMPPIPAAAAPPPAQAPPACPPPAPPATNAAASQARTAGGPPDPAKIMEALKRLLMELQDEAKLDTVATNLGILLYRPELGGEDSAFNMLSEAFQAVAFSPSNVYNQISVVPYMNLLTRLPEPFKQKMRDTLIPKVLKHLTHKRPIAADRATFFCEAEAFAMLIYLEFVSVQGAVQTIMTLLKKEDTRCAAITMLGKTIELCHSQARPSCMPLRAAALRYAVVEKCPAETLDKLRQALSSVQDEAFAYDKDYINQCMQWGPTPTLQ